MDERTLGSKARRMVGVVLFGIGLSYVVVGGGVFALQRKLVFPAPPAQPMPTVPGAEQLAIPGNPGPIHALRLPPKGDAPTVLFFHGNGEQLADLPGFVQALHLKGLGVVAMEYPGYGASAGQKPSEEAIDADAETLIRWLEANRGLTEDRLILAGHSLGTGVATEMAARGHGRRLVLLSPYTSIAAVGARVVPWLPTRLLTLDRFDTAAKAPKIEMPVLIVHGGRDVVVPVRMGKKLAKIFPHATLDLGPGRPTMSSTTSRISPGRSPASPGASRR